MLHRTNIASGPWEVQKLGISFGVIHPPAFRHIEIDCPGLHILIKASWMIHTFPSRTLAGLVFIASPVSA